MDVTAYTAAAPARAGGDKIARLLGEIDALIADDEAADRQITGAWRTFSDIVAAAHTHTWDAYSVDLSTDAESFRQLSRRQQDAVKRVFGTIFRAESIVDDWMDRIVAAMPLRARLRVDARRAHDAGARRADAPRQPAAGRDRGARHRRRRRRPRGEEVQQLRRRDPLRPVRGRDAAPAAGRTARSRTSTPRSSSTA